jgi:hypothetical protein
MPDDAKKKNTTPEEWIRTSAEVLDEVVLAKFDEVMLAKYDPLPVEKEFNALKGFDKARRWLFEVEMTCNICKKLLRFYCWWEVVEEGSAVDKPVMKLFSTERAAQQYADELNVRVEANHRHVRDSQD